MFRANSQWGRLVSKRDFIFDQPHARRFVEARQELLVRALEDLRGKAGIRTVADVGCGVGYFSEFLAKQGFEVSGFDGRPGNIEEAQRRYPKLRFGVADVEDAPVAAERAFDMVLCAGLLYHLENPLRALRNLAAVTDKVLVIESYATPQKGTMFFLRDEADYEDQSLTSMALYPSESSIVKICYRIGFAAVCRLTPLPRHEDFEDTYRQKRKRTMLVASRVKLDSPYLARVAEPQDYADPWRTKAGGVLGYASRLRERLSSKKSAKRKGMPANAEEMKG